MWGRWSSSNFPSSAPGGEGGGERYIIQDISYQMASQLSSSSIRTHVRSCMFYKGAASAYRTCVQTQSKFQNFGGLQQKNYVESALATIVYFIFSFLLKINLQKLYFGLHQKRHETALASIVCLKCVASSTLSPAPAPSVYLELYLCVFVFVFASVIRYLSLHLL